MDTSTAPEANGAGVRRNSSGLKRSLGIWMATALVIGNTWSGRESSSCPPPWPGLPGGLDPPVRLHGVGPMLLALVFATLRRLPRGRRADVPRPQGLRRLHRLPGRLEATGQRLGRECGDRVPFADLPHPFWGYASKNWIAVVVAISLIWILTFANIWASARPERSRS